MSLSAAIESAKRRARKIIKVESPPDLTVHVYNEGEKNPTGGSPWELSIMVEKKRPLM